MREAVPLFQPMQVKIDRLNLVLDEGLSGVRVIRAFDRGAHQSERFDAANLDLTDTAIAVNRLMALLMPAMFLMMNLTSVAIIWFGGHAHRRRRDAGRRDDRVAAVRDADPVRGVHGHGDVRDAAARGGVGGAHQRGARRGARDRRSGAAAAAAGARSAVTSSSRTSRSSIPGAEEPALTGVSFTAHPGEVTAIIGGTGSGKSTLAGLIPRFYDVNAGPRAGGRRRRARDDAGGSARADRLRAAEGGAVHAAPIAEQHPLRPRATRPTTRCAMPRRWRRPPSSSTAMPEQLRVAGLAGRHQPVGRPEAAAGDRARARAAARRLRLRRQLLGARLRDRRQAARGAQGRDRRRHGVHRRRSASAR